MRIRVDTEKARASILDEVRVGGSIPTSYDRKIKIMGACKSDDHERRIPIFRFVITETFSEPIEVGALIGLLAPK